MVRSLETCQRILWRIFTLLQSTKWNDRWKILSRTLLAHCPSSVPPCEWWCYQSSLTTGPIWGSTLWPIRPSNTSEIRPTLQATPRAWSHLSQRRSHRSLWKYTYFPLFGGQPLTAVFFHCEFLNLPFEPFINFFYLRFLVWPWNYPIPLSICSRSWQHNHLLAWGVLT